MATLKLENISKQFSKHVWGVRRIDFEVKDKEFIVFLGPSGCGKTTTLRMIAGLEEATTGSIFIDGIDVTEFPPRKRDLSMVFQSYAVWPHLTVYNNIAFALRLKKMPDAKIHKIVQEVADMVKIGELLERYPRQLSGGQQQRVALARALAVKPKLFLMDEPLSNLDAKLRVTMRTELKTIHQSTQATSIFVTHDQSEAMSMADRIVIMKDGEVVQVGTPDDVYFQSADVFVAGFIGTPPTNFFNVEIQQRDGHVVLQHPFFEFELDDARSKTLQPYRHSQLILGIRPENILITDQSNTIFSQEALVVEPQGSHQVIAIDLDGQVIKVVAPAHPKVFPGETLHLTFQQERIHVFDVETQKRIG
jgi:multiple sugar transport system ATP-binding protein